MAEEEKKGAGKKEEKEEKVKIAKPQERKKPIKKVKEEVKKEKEKTEVEEKKKVEKPQEEKKPAKKVKKVVKKEKEKAEVKTKEKAEKPKEGKKPTTKVKKEVKKEKEKAEVEKKEKEEKKEEPEEEAPEEEEEEEEEEAAEEEKEEEIEIIEEEEEYAVKIKPKLNKELKRNLKIRSDIKKKTPDFKRQEWFRYKRLGDAWRKPRGMHSKMRKHKGYRSNIVSVGYGSPVKTRNLHPSGFEEVMVYNVKDLKKINPKNQAARIGHSVGTRKRIEIEETAEEKGIRVLNPGRL